jgi:arylsulfatase A-like enzyme
VARAAAGETTVTIEGESGRPARLGFHVEGDGRGGPGWALWEAPRLLGDGPATAVPADPPPQADATRLAGLRRALAGANVILVVLDAAGARHFGCYGYARRTTPEIDRIAAEGVLFEEAFTPAAYTLAAVASIFTSQSPDRHQNLDPRRPTYRQARVVLPELLRAHGAQTGGFVANSMAGPAFGFERGFGEFREVYAELGRNARAFREVLPGWLQANRERRFFAYVHFREPHFPWSTTAASRSLRKRWRTPSAFTTATWPRPTRSWASCAARSRSRACGSGRS